MYVCIYIYIYVYKYISIHIGAHRVPREEDGRLRRQARQGANTQMIQYVIS